MKIPPFELERYFAKHEFKAPYLLCASDFQSYALSEILNLEPGANESLQNLWLGYTESTGHPELREEIANLYETAKAGHILVHSGAEEAIFNLWIATGSLYGDFKKILESVLGALILQRAFRALTSIYKKPTSA
jgi:hypothetical protein